MKNGIRKELGFKNLLVLTEYYQKEEANWFGIREIVKFMHVKIVIENAQVINLI